MMYLLFCFWNDGRTFSTTDGNYQIIKQQWDDIETRRDDPGKCVVSLTYGNEGQK